jgi:FKBP-type peptidyl-prolyl cis-trans isomerase FkpA
MQKTVQTITCFLLMAVITINFSCQKEEEKQRTLDQELAELDMILKSRIEDGYDIDTTDSFLYYIILHEDEEEEGPTPQKGDTCYIHYYAFFTDGTLYDKSENYFNDGIWRLSYKHPDSDIIPGLQEGIGQMKKGTRIEMYIPSYLAYGSEGTEGVPPFTTLVYITEMHDLIPKSD